MYKNFFKRIIDFFVALIAISVLSPLLIVVTICLTIANKGGGAFFCPYRPGKNGQLFKLVKFKSMRDAFDASGNKLPDAEKERDDWFNEAPDNIQNAWFNENILFVNPFLFVLAAFSLRCLSKKGDQEKRRKRERRVTYSYLALVCIVFILTVLKVLFQDIHFLQFNWSAILTMFLFYMPNWLRMNRYKIAGREPESDMDLIY